MTRPWLAGTAAFAMMTGVAVAQSASSTATPTTTSAVPASGSSSAGLAASGTPLPPPANPSVTNYGTGGMQSLPGSPPDVGSGTHLK